MPVLTPSAADLEELALDGLDLNDDANFDAEALVVTPPSKRLVWLAQRHGDALGDVGTERRTITLRIRPRVTGTMDGALAKLAQITDKLQKAERTEGGIEFTWTPAGSSKTVTAYVLAGEITGMPVVVTGDDAGWFIRRPPVEIRLDCRPFLYGPEETITAVTNANPLQEIVLSAVKGDVPAEGRLVLTDNATQARDFADWGIHTGTVAESTAAVLIDSASLTVSGYSGTATTRTGAYSASGVVRGTTSPNWVALATTGALTTFHGARRVKLRLYTTTADAQVRVAWRSGDSLLTRTAPVTPHLTNLWVEVDLGVIDVRNGETVEIIPEFRADTAGQSLDCDYILQMPADRYAKARAVTQMTTPTSFDARDEFDQTAGALTGKTAPVGGAWSGSGDADDFTVETTGKTAQRTAVSDSSLSNGRFAYVGSAVGASGARVGFKFSSFPQLGTGAWLGVLARRSASGWLFAGLQLQSTISASRFVVAKSGTIIQQTDPSYYFGLANTLYYAEVEVTTAGTYTARLIGHTGENVLISLTGYDADLVAGQPLATGTRGFYDAWASTNVSTRNFDHFAAWTYTNDRAIYSGQSFEFRSDSSKRENAAGTKLADYTTRGSRFYVPQAGDEGLVSRVVARAKRNDVETLPDDQIADSTTAQAFIRSRHLNAPR